jgi:16S rRNA pseudouridine516 synthase
MTALLSFTAPMDLERILFTQGFGSRRQCRALITDARVTIGGTPCTNPSAVFTTAAPSSLEFEVDGARWQYREKAYLVMNKPPGYECSRDPQHHLSVFNLLPPQLTERGVQCVGRLDQDTTGLLLLSDDGAFVHAFTSPKRKVPKVYLATTRHPLDTAQVDALRNGVLLHGESQPIAAESAIARDEQVLELTVLEGKYHQVKRMVAASGNRVEKLHRERIGGYALPDDLAEGQWRWLDEADLMRLREG